MKHKRVGFGDLTMQKQLIIGQMALDELPFSVQNFFVNVLDWLGRDFVTTKDLAINQSYSERTVSNYMRLLSERGYVTRHNYRAWVLGDKNNDYYVLREDNIFGKCARKEGIKI